MGGRRSLGSKIFFGFDETTPEVPHPGSVNSDAGCERVGGINEPLGEVEPIAARGGSGRAGLTLERMPGASSPRSLLGRVKSPRVRR